MINNPKILLLGQYRGSCGWSEATKDYIRALSKVTKNLAIRPLYMSNEIGKTPEDLFQFEFNKFEEYDYCIQYCLPHLFSFDNRFKKSIGIFHSETSGWRNGWIEKSNLMSEIWVSTGVEATNLTKSGVKVPIHVVPMPVDVNKFLQSYEPLPIPTLTQDTFVFYFIGEFITRKGLLELITAFHTEFSPNEDVALLIKTNKSGVDPNTLAEEVVKFSENIKKTLRLRRPEDYKPEIIITERLSEEKLNRLHKTCNCFVLPTHGESWSRPCMDALGFGNPVIVTSHTGPVEYVESRWASMYDRNGYHIDSVAAPVMCSDPPMLDLYTGYETWRQPDICDLKRTMRGLVSLSRRDRENWDAVRENAADTPYNYTYDKVANIMKELLC